MCRRKAVAWGLSELLDKLRPLSSLPSEGVHGRENATADDVCLLRTSLLEDGVPGQAVPAEEGAPEPLERLPCGLHSAHLELAEAKEPRDDMILREH